MSKPYRLVVFDWEGTLGDTLGQILNTIAVEAKRLNAGAVDEMVARHYVVFGLVVAIRKLFPHLPDNQQKLMLESVQQSLALKPCDAYLIPGAKSIILSIHQAGLDLAIATNKGQHSLQRTLQACGLGTYFTVTRSAGQAPAKPCPQMLEEIIEVCGVTPAQTLMVGDSVSDIEMASALNVDAIGVNFYHDDDQQEELVDAGAIQVIEDYQQLADYLQLPLKNSES